MIGQIAKILYTTDLSKNSFYAFGYAVQIARQCGAKITVLHVVEPVAGTGLRKKELLRVTWEDINLERNVLQVIEGKGGETRFVPINVNAGTEILTLAKKAKGKYVFHDSRERPFDDIRKAFNQAVKKAGLENVHFHDLRRTFGTECVF